MTDGENDSNGNGNAVGEALGKLSPFFKGDGRGAVDVELSGDQAQPVDEAELNGRLYHDEHFAHGVHLTAVDEAMPMARKVTTVNSAMTKNLDSDRMTATAKPVQLGAPMPKWPAGHQSAAFEAVSIKHSYILSPPEVFAECAHHGEEKYKYPWYKLWILTIIAGCYVGFGYTTCLLVGGMLDQAPGVGTPQEENYGLYKLIFGAVGFPFGFTTIIVCGADLYTSLCAYMTAAWWEGKVRWHAVLYMLAVSWTGNFIGCAIMVGLMKASEVYSHKTTTLMNITYGKLEYGWGAVFVKGIFANWLVGIATWMANAAQDLTGKAVGIWLPISAFAMLGFEHCIANQFLFLMAWAMGANITAKQFIWDNLIPSTLGNYFGGGVCLGTVYAFAYGRTPKLMGAWVDSKLKRA